MESLYERCTSVKPLMDALSKDEAYKLRPLFRVHRFLTDEFGTTMRLLYWDVPECWDAHELGLTSSSRPWFLEACPEPTMWGGVWSAGVVEKPERLRNALVFTPATLPLALSEGAERITEAVAAMLKSSAQCTEKELATNVIALHARSSPPLEMDATLRLLCGRPMKRRRVDSSGEN